MTEVMEGQLTFDQDIWCGKMSQELSPPTKEKTAELCWKKWQGSSMKESLFLDLRKSSGGQQESSSVTDTQSHGESSMHSIGEYRSGEEEFVSLLTSMDTQHLKSYLARINTTEAPSEVIESHLSDILETNPDPKYNLSAKACQGILNRAERRGKELPKILREALEQTIARSLMQEETETDKPSAL